MSKQTNRAEPHVDVNQHYPVLGEAGHIAELVVSATEYETPIVHPDHYRQTLVALLGRCQHVQVEAIFTLWYYKTRLLARRVESSGVPGIGLKD